MERVFPLVGLILAMIDTPYYNDTTNLSDTILNYNMVVVKVVMAKIHILEEKSNSLIDI